MRIGLVAPPWYPVPPPAYGGIELVVGLLAQEWVRAGHQVTVAAVGGSAPDGTLVTSLASAPGTAACDDPFLEATHALLGLEAVAETDVVHDHSGVTAAAIARRDRSLPPLVHTLHGPWTPTARQFYDLIDHDVHLVAISEAQRAANPGVRYAATIHNGIALDAYPMNDGPRDEYLIYIGRASAGKNPDGAIRIARASGRELKMVVKRHDPVERDYWDHVVDPLLGADVEVLEGVGHDMKVALLQRAHAMIFPIQWPEPFGLVMVEAMACGTPVLARPLGAAREVVEPGVTGFLFDTEAELASAVPLVDELDRHACRSRVATCFSARRMAHQYEQLFAELIATADARVAPRASRLAAPRAANLAARFPGLPRRVARRLLPNLLGGADV